MNFHINVWNKYRLKADVIGRHISSCQDKKTRVINLDKDVLSSYVKEISCILLECSNYMDKCGLTMIPGLWKYNPQDPTTHPSSKKFLYKNRICKKVMRSYGKEFMAN